jgi:hypothetical protein
MKFRTLIRHQPGTLLEFAVATIALQPKPPFDAKGAGFAEFETNDESVIDRLLEIPEGFAVVDGVPPAKGAQETDSEPDEPDTDEPEQAPSAGAAGAQSFILTDKDTGATLDLGALDDAALQAFVKEHGIKGVHHKTLGAGGDKLRAAIVKATAE